MVYCCQRGFKGLPKTFFSYLGMFAATGHQLLLIVVRILERVWVIQIIAGAIVATFCV